MNRRIEGVKRMKEGEERGRKRGGRECKEEEGGDRSIEERK